MRKPRRGFALVMVLSIIVLLSFVIVAFLIRSLYLSKIEARSIAGFRAEQLTFSALDLVVEDLRREILAGSVIEEINGVRILQSVDSKTIVPHRSVGAGIPVTESRFVNLIKQSSRGGPLFPGSAPFNGNATTALLPSAAAVSTSSESANRRAIVPQRWNLPKLIADPGFTNDQVPDWMYFSNESGVENVTAPGRDVAGRFAFNIYNIGGLLNANAAGNYGNVQPSDISHLKATLAGADLTSLPGVIATDSLLQWRNQSTASDYVNHTITSGLRSGFLSSTGQDKLFVNRQDLIQWVEEKGGSNITTAVLPFLTQFSREVNAPAFLPITPVGSTIDYRNQANVVGTTNRFTPSVRVIAPFVRSDGTTAVVGEPLIKTRFALSRIRGINAFGINGTLPSTLVGGSEVVADEDTVRRDFGLRWDAPSNLWIYCGPDGNTAKDTIDTLDSVATQNREPNFFETLKAAILSGSLGNDGGVSNSDTVAYDQNSDYQIIQIGLNIIDQFRPDDLPTRVAFDPTAGAPPIIGSTKLPGLNKMLRMFYRPPEGANTAMGVQPAFRSFVGAWFVPEFWNPYQTSLFSDPPTGVPTRLRIRAKNGDAAHLYATMGLNDTDIPGQDFGVGLSTPPTVFTEANSTIEFNNGTAFMTPHVLADTSGFTNASSSEPDNQISDPSGFGTLWGIHVGTNNFPDSRPELNTPQNSLRYDFVRHPEQCLGSVTIITDPLVTFLLEYEVPESPGQWELYDLVKNTSSFSTEQGLQGYSGANNGVINTEMHIANSAYLPSALHSDHKFLLRPIPCSAAQRIDPRADRFGVSNAYATQLGFLRAQLKPGAPTYWNPSTFPTATHNATGFDGQKGGIRMRGVQGWNRLVGGGNAVGVTKAGWSNSSDGWGNYVGALADNRVGSNMSYLDRDGINRPAAGAYSEYLMDNLAMRPVMLNRSFDSVGDLGYSNRGEAWKELDFFTPRSGDAGLLEYFSAHEEPTITANRICLNTAPQEVLKSILMDGIMTEASQITQISEVEANDMAEALRQEITGPQGPLVTRADLVWRFSENTSLQSYPEKSRREAPIRALAPVGQTRTWNLLVDMIVQTGTFRPNAASLNEFIVEGERRVWLSLAIDRITGRIIDQQLEVVRE